MFLPTHLCFFVDRRFDDTSGSQVSCEVLSDLHSLKSWWIAWHEQSSKKGVFPIQAV